MTQNSIFEKWERTRVRHTHKHPPVINVNQALADRSDAGGNESRTRSRW